MSTKDDVRAALEEHIREFVSGSSLARRLHVSRNAVWRTVKSLREEGFIISAVTNRGYRLEQSDVLTEAAVRRFLPDNGTRWDIRIVPVVSSTNTVLKEMAEKGAPEGTILIATEQTAGRGRMGRRFFSPGGTGVYLSLLLRPVFSPSESLFITTAAAVAVAEAVEGVTGAETKIKWVNDVYLDGKKMCGILTEASLDMEGGRLAYAVLGIGINMRPPDGGYPDELRTVMTSVFEKIAYDSDKRNRIVGEVISRFGNFYEHLPEKTFLPGYRRRSLLNGLPVDVISGKNRVSATALEIDDECRLHVRYADGREDYLSSGEVSVRPRPDGTRLPL